MRPRGCILLSGRSIFQTVPQLARLSANGFEEQRKRYRCRPGQWTAGCKELGFASFESDLTSSMVVKVGRSICGENYECVESLERE